MPLAAACTTSNFWGLSIVGRRPNRPPMGHLRLGQAPPASPVTSHGKVSAEKVESGVGCETVVSPTPSVPEYKTFGNRFDQLKTM
jgi:hypothetical protein